MVFAPVQSTGWSLAAIIPESEVMASVYARMARLLALLGAGLFVILSIVVLVSNRITRPIRQVASAAESIGRGNLESRAPDMRGNDEVACLARTFNAMVSDLKTNIECRIQEESARREVEGELEAARRIQASLLPAPLPPNATQAFALKAINLPAKSVAGDFYDFFFLDAGRLALVVADVSGKGVPAAMYMAVSRTKLRDFASRELSPAEVLSRVNRSLTLENESEMFVSMFLGYYDVRTGELIYANAGHNPPYLVRENGILDSLAPTGPLVAVFPDADFQNANCRLNPNDLLVLYTDGITEADRNGHLYGEERLEKMLTSSWTSSPEDLSRTIVDNAREFANGELADDATVLVLKRRALA
jgi:sigma-B regulation protein RsbU (phosphoserine phosphatase)